MKSDAISLVLTGKTWAETAELLKKRYERGEKRAEQVTVDEVFENLMNAYARTFDPHSNYFSARNSEEYRIQMSLSYEGIGATLQSDDEYASIVNLLPGGPAAVAGTLGIKDRITGIGQDKEGPFEDVIGWRLDDVVQKIRGKGRHAGAPAGAARWRRTRFAGKGRRTHARQGDPGRPGRQEGAQAHHPQRASSTASA